MSLLASASLVAWLGLMVQHRYDDLVPVHSQLQEIVRAAGNSGRPILSDNPLVPLEAGQRPYVLDAFMFRVLQERVPNFGDPMWQMLKQRRFGAVVLVDNPDSEEGKDTYSNYHFGDSLHGSLTAELRTGGKRRNGIHFCTAQESAEVH